jgi:predicted nuclease of predicted toxin-antitoxin system
VASKRLLANMNISPKTVKALRKEGWDIDRVSQFLPVNTSDQEILAFARQEDRVVIAQDLDFSTLLALGGFDRPRLIILRLSEGDPDTVSRRLIEVLPRIEQALSEGCSITIEDVAVRVRKLPIG